MERNEPARSFLDDHLPRSISKTFRQVQRQALTNSIPVAVKIGRCQDRFGYSCGPSTPRETKEQNVIEMSAPKREHHALSTGANV